MSSHKKRRIGAGKAPGRIGVVSRQPAVWAAATTAMALTCGRRGRRAAVRGSALYLLGAVVGNGLKPLFQRPQPRHSSPRKPQVVRGSFPSGHGAAEVAFTFAAAQELPASFLAFGAMAAFGHWSLVRARKHYVSDMVVGGTIGLGLVAATSKVWPASAERHLRMDVWTSDRQDASALTVESPR